MRLRVWFVLISMYSIYYFIFPVELDCKGIWYGIFMEITSISSSDSRIHSFELCSKVIFPIIDNFEENKALRILLVCLPTQISGIHVLPEGSYN